MITTVKLINVSCHIRYHLFVCFCGGALRKLLISNTVLLTLVIVLYVRSLTPLVVVIVV